MPRRHRRWGVSERILRRWRDRYEEDGADGLVDRRVGQPSPKRAPEDELERVRTLYRETYQGFTIKHFHEKLAQRYNYKLGYTATRLYLQKTGTVPLAPRRGAHRRKRPRRPMRGMLLHQDGSKHAWLAGQPALDLIITMDDATSEPHSAAPLRADHRVGAGSQARGNDNCVRWHGRSLQIPPTPLRPHLVRATVRVHDYPDGTLAIFKGPQRLASLPPAAPGSTEDLAA